MEQFFSQFTLLGIIILIDVLIALYIFLKNPKNPVHYTFFIMVIGAAIWSGGIGLIFFTKNFFYNTLIFFGGTTVVLGLTLFGKVFPSEYKLPKIFLINCTPLFILYLGIPFNVYVSGITFNNAGLPTPVNGPLFPVYIITMGAYMLYGLFLLSRTFHNARGLARQQVQYLLLGAVLFMFTAFIFDILLPGIGNFRLNLLGPISSIALVGFTGYAIARHQLLNIRMVIQRGIIYSVLLAIIIGVYIISLFTLGNYFELAARTTNFGSALLTIFAGIFGIPYLDKYFRFVTDRWFHKDQYRYSDALHALSEAVNRNLELEGLIHDTSFLLSQILKANTVRFIIFGEYPLIYIDGNLKHVTHSKQRSAAVEEVRAMLWAHPELMIHSSLRSNGHNAISETGLDALVTLGMGGKIVLSIPLMLDKKVLGVINLGEKRSGDAYTSEDMVLLQTFAYEAAIALEKAELYNEVRDYSRELEVRVAERTTELQELQEEQRQTMIDISHALQTPLTIIKGTIEILNIRGVHDKELGAAEKAIDEASQLLYDMMNLAQLENQFNHENNHKKVDLSKLAEDVAEYVNVIAEGKHIKIRTEITTDVFVKGDEKQLKDVIINLMSNAVKYIGNGKERTITLSVLAKDDKAVLKVIDTGIGMKDKDRAQVFQRFYRTKEAREGGVRGTGLGLAITKTILKKHKGTIGVESIEGVGSTFTAVIPLFQEESGEE